MFLQNIKNKIKQKRIIRINKKNNVIINPSSFFYTSKASSYVSIGKDSVIMNSSVDSCTYIGHRSVVVNSYIGKYVSIANNVNILWGGHPINSTISSSPFFYNEVVNKVKSPINAFTYDENVYKYDINNKKYSTVIGNDVWVGVNAVIMGGVKIGDGAIIGANAVVTKDVPPYAIVVGAPAKVIKYRFSKEQIDKLLSIKWWDWPINKVKELGIEFKDVDEFIDKQSSK